MIFETCLEGYLKHLAVKNYARGTIKWRNTYLLNFFSYLKNKGIDGDLRAVTKSDVESFKAYLKTVHLTRRGTALTDSSFSSYVTAVTDFFRWLERTGQILITPAPKPERVRRRSRPLKLPQVLSEEEVLKILESSPINTPAGLRDRAIMELFYATGIRRSEMVNLNVEDYFPERQELMIVEGKGKKDRLVPVGECACLFLDAYLRLVRPWLARSADEKALFLNSQNGGRLNGETVAYLVQKAVKRSGIGKGVKVTPHTFRHSMATHLFTESG